MSDPTWRILEGDCRDVLTTLPERSVHTVVTSPPYFGLRDYGTGQWEGGDPACDHVDGRASEAKNRLAPAQSGGMGNKTPERDQASTARATVQHREECPCGARRTDRQIGLEPAPDHFVEALVAVFREVRRVLRDDGTVWLNLGDSYADRANRRSDGESFRADRRDVVPAKRNTLGNGVKAKDLIGIPWMVAFALRADGWYLRSDIIWHKPNPMPESIADRPTKAHEYLFLLSKSPRYFYDGDAIREDAHDWGTRDRAGAIYDGSAYPDRMNGHTGLRDMDFAASGRNKRTVWTVTTKPYDGAHFATFPPDLIEPCVLAGAPDRACSACGAPWHRVVERAATNHKTFDHPERTGGAMSGGVGKNVPDVELRTVGFEPSCACSADTIPGAVLDPFNGAGTTGLVAVRTGRRYIGVELNPAYAQLARDRIATDIRLGHRRPQRGPQVPDDQDALFDLEATA